MTALARLILANKIDWLLLLAALTIMHLAADPMNTAINNISDALARF